MDFNNNNYIVRHLLFCLKKYTNTFFYPIYDVFFPFLLGG
jgi:hypothetical protein